MKHYFILTIEAESPEGFGVPTEEDVSSIIEQGAALLFSAEERWGMSSSGRRLVVTDVEQAEAPPGPKVKALRARIENLKERQDLLRKIREEQETLNLLREKAKALGIAD